MRCTSWVFFHKTFARMSVTCYCVGLIADSGAIESRERRLSAGEIARSREMIKQGYGQRPFCDIIIHTDDADFDVTCQRLIEDVRLLADVRKGASPDFSRSLVPVRFGATPD